MLEGKELVLEICRQGSFTRAAEALYMTQPALSAAVKKLEGKLGFTLFDRSSQPICLTPDGQIYADALRQLEQLERETLNRLSSLHGLQSGSITVGGSSLFTSVMLPPVLRHYHSLYPKIELRLREGSTSQLVELLAGGELDLLLDNCDLPLPQAVDMPLSREQLYLAVPAIFCRTPALSGGLTHRELAQGKKAPDVSIDALGDTPLVLLRQGNDTTARVRRLCRECHFRPNVTISPDQLMTAFNMAACGMGAAIATDLIVRALPYETELLFFPLKGEAAHRQLHFFRRSQPMTAALEAFMALVQQDSLLGMG